MGASEVRSIWAKSDAKPVFCQLCIKLGLLVLHACSNCHLTILVSTLLGANLVEKIAIF